MWLVVYDFRPLSTAREDPSTWVVVAPWVDLLLHAAVYFQALELFHPVVWSRVRRHHLEIVSYRAKLPYSMFTWCSSLSSSTWAHFCVWRDESCAPRGDPTWRSEGAKSPEG